MSIGTSGRIVIEVDPDLKRQLYGVLNKDGVTLKEWFLRNVATYLHESHQLSMEFGGPMSSRRAN